MSVRVFIDLCSALKKAKLEVVLSEDVIIMPSL
jgi:hypothetical protein